MGGAGTQHHTCDARDRSEVEVILIEHAQVAQTGNELSVFMAIISIRDVYKQLHVIP